MEVSRDNPRCSILVADQLSRMHEKIDIIDSKLDLYSERIVRNEEQIKNQKNTMRIIISAIVTVMTGAGVWLITAMVGSKP